MSSIVDNSWLQRKRFWFVVSEIIPCLNIQKLVCLRCHNVVLALIPILCKWVRGDYCCYEGHLHYCSICIGVDCRLYAIPLAHKSYQATGRFAGALATEEDSLFSSCLLVFPVDVHCAMRCWLVCVEKGMVVKLEIELWNIINFRLDNSRKITTVNSCYL
mgnify:CR=1 FL=1